MSFIFDDRPEREAENRAVFSLFQRMPKPPELVGIGFMNSHKVRPLQAADLVAWEFYTCANGILRHGRNSPVRQELLHLVKKMALYGQIATKDAIEELKARILRNEKANHEVRGIFDDVRRISAERLSSL